MGFLILPHARSSNHITAIFAIFNCSLFIGLFIAVGSLANSLAVLDMLLCGQWIFNMNFQIYFYKVDKSLL